MHIFCYQFNIERFRRKTAHMTSEQRGVYRDLLDAYYYDGGNLPADPDQLARIVGIHTESERSALAYAIAEFFEVRNGRLWQRTGAEEIAKMRDKSFKAKASAKAKTKKIQQKDTSVRTTERSANGIANGLLTNNQEPISPSSEGDKDSSPPAEGLFGEAPPVLKVHVNFEKEFSDFYVLYPRHVSRQDALKAFTKARKGGVSYEAIIEGCRRYAAECRGKEQQYIAYPASWLNSGRWEDAPGANKPGGPAPHANGGGQPSKGIIALKEELIREIEDGLSH